MREMMAAVGAGFRVLLLVSVCAAGSTAALADTKKKAVKVKKTAPSEPSAPATPAVEPMTVEPVGGSVALRRPNAVYAELLGRGLLYSIGYDRSVTENLALGAGFAAFSASGISVLLIPIYGSYYFTSDSNRGFVSAGFDIISATGTFTDGFKVTGTGVAPVIGGGYEYRGDGGFLFRGAPYLFFTNSTVNIWLGLTLGYAF